MKFSEQWLRSWVNPDVSREDLVARLSMVGLEVDAVQPVAGAFSGVVVGEILSAEQQVVAGMNYRLKLKLEQGDEVKTAEATIWARVWLEKDERYQLTAWRFLDEPE